MSDVEYEEVVGPEPQDVMDAALRPLWDEEPERHPLEDIKALWPELRWPVVNVLVEGPSIRNFSKDDLLYGPVIAVNHALAVPELEADFWATTDIPHNLWEWSKRYRTKKLRYFTTDQNVGVFGELLGPRQIRKVYTSHLTQMGIETDDGKPIILPTLITLLGWLWRLDVKRVRLFGCDMKGQGSPLSGDWSEKTTQLWDYRWRVERVLLAYTMRAYHDSGARIDRWPRTSPSRTRPPPPRRSAPESKATSS